MNVVVVDLSAVGDGDALVLPGRDVAVTGLVFITVMGSRLDMGAVGDEVLVEVLDMDDLALVILK